MARFVFRPLAVTSSPHATDRRPAGRPEYPLAERVVDLVLAPRRLFGELRRRPRVAGALTLSTALSAATFLSMLPFAEEDLSPLVVGAALVFRLVILWVYLAAVALSGMAFGGFQLAELGYRHWLALAAHCSLIALPLSLLQIGGVLWTGNPDFELSLAELVPGEAGSVTGAFLARISFHSLAFLSLFSFGAAVFTDVPWRKSAAFVFGLWAGLWFILAWFTT